MRSAVARSTLIICITIAVCVTLYVVLKRAKWL